MREKKFNCLLINQLTLVVMCVGMGCDPRGVFDYQVPTITDLPLKSTALVGTISMTMLAPTPPEWLCLHQTADWFNLIINNSSGSRTIMWAPGEDLAIDCLHGVISHCFLFTVSKKKVFSVRQWTGRMEIMKAMNNWQTTDWN